MPAPLLAPAGKLQGSIITDLLTDPGVHPNRWGGHYAGAAFRCVDRPRRPARRHYRRLWQMALSDTRLAWHRQACRSAQGRPGGTGARDDDG